MTDLITCHYIWVTQCLLRYKCDPPTGYWWENAHHPLSIKQGEINTVKLWYPDHVVHGALQTLNTNYPCMHGYRFNEEVKILSEVYPEYLSLYKKAHDFHQSFAGKKAVETKSGVHSEEYLNSPERIENLKLRAPSMGRIGGTKTFELGKGCHSEEYRSSPEYLEVRSKTGTKNYLNKVGFHSDEYRNSPEYLITRQNNGKILNSEVWVSTKDGFKSTAAGVAHHNRANGWDPKDRVRES